MTFPSPSQDLTLRIYLALAQYPILSALVRARMRQELFQRGIISTQAFEVEVRQKAIQSQQLEGLHDPLLEEPSEMWEQRLSHVRDHLTDFYFAYNLPYDLFEQILRQALAERGRQLEGSLSTFNPELAPQNLLFEQGYAIENMPPDERRVYQARLQEIKAVLIRTIISDQLGYLQIARDWFTIGDLDEIRKRKIGSGKIGGKSAGMLLAARILNQVGDEDIRHNLSIPPSFYIGADLTYAFMAVNCLTHWMDQKYKSDQQIYEEYPSLYSDFIHSQLPEDTLEQLEKLLKRLGNKPLVVRSSSLLEDNFGTSFAGKYESHFCPNQGSLEENLAQLSEAIRRVFASIFNPDALLYRRAKGLLDYDERMAILLQVVEGETFGDVYLPHASGVAYSRNLFRWSPQIRRQDGFLRLVWGLGTRAVDRTSNDYARLVALSHPTLHPESDVRATIAYSQKYVDLIHLKQNRFMTLPIGEVLRYDYSPLRYLAQIDEGGYLSTIRIIQRDLPVQQAVLTFDELFRRTKVAPRLTKMLQLLEEHYRSPVDLEFTLRIVENDDGQADVKVTILQCRPQSAIHSERFSIPTYLEPEDVIFSTPRMAPEGFIENIRYVLFVTPKGYFSLPTPADRSALRRFISRLNDALADENFICVGPGRWGTSTPDLGIAVGYGDIYHARALVELTGEGSGPAPEASYGTHFFQDLVESHIFPLAIYLQDKDAIFNEKFFYQTPNRIAHFLPGENNLPECLRLIAVEDFRPGCHLNVVMDNEKGATVAFLTKDEK